jgi:peptide/nickel transport system substrate-binding protein
MFHHKQLFAAFVGLGATALLSGAGIAADKVLRFVPQADLKTLDPVGTVNNNTRNFGYMVYDTLFGVDKDFKPQPQMVERWSVSDDKLTWSFTLRSGLKWHDGTPVKAADCVASIQRWAARDSLGALLKAAMASIEPSDDATFTIKLKEPFNALLDALAKPSSLPAFMMPERLAKTDPFQNNTEVVGSGPFRFVASEWAPGSKLVFVKNVDYVPRGEPASFSAGGKVVKVDRVEWLTIPDASTASAALSAGEVDWYELPPTDLLPVLNRSKDLIVKAVDPYGSQALLRFNHTQPPFDKREIRQAVLAVADQNDYMTAIVGDRSNWLPCYSVFPCNTPLKTETGADVLKGKRDFDKARELLKQGGYKGEKVVVISAGDVPIMQTLSLVTVDLLKKIGMNAELQATDQGAYFARRNNRESVDKGGWSIFQTWFNAPDLLNPVAHLPLQGNGAKGYAGWPENAEVEALRRAWLKAKDLDEQKEIAGKIQTLAFADVFYIPLGQFKLPTAYRRDLTGVIPAPIPFFWNLEKN